MNGANLLTTVTIGVPKSLEAVEDHAVWIYSCRRILIVVQRVVSASYQRCLVEAMYQLIRS
jgi:hypothetical protein